jgi:ATP-binding cassette subfamily B protein
MASRLAELGGWLAAWVVAQLLTQASLSRLALEVGGVIRAWLLRRMLRLEPERIRHAGIGDLLGRVLEAESLDALALGGGAQTLAGGFELATGALVVWRAGAPASPTLACAALGVLALGALGRWFARRFSSWAGRHRALSHDLVERMCGHATVLVQDRADRRAILDRRDVDGYAAEARRMDRAELALTVGLPRLWLLATLATLAVSAASPSAAAGGMATRLAGIWLFYSGLRHLADAAPVLVAVRHAWRRMAPLITPRDRAEEAALAEASAPSDGPAAVAAVAKVATATTAPRGQGVNGPMEPAHDEVSEPRSEVLLEVRGVSFQFPDRPPPVLQDVTLAIRAGERILIEGPSGRGKSTLAALLTGLKTPTAGALSLNGVAQRSLGLRRWRQQVGAVPQFHENHVLSAELAFNLLLGRRWPPRLADLEAAQAVCEALGLGALLARMPAGIQQQVGETGWQLSHGEQSRIFLARSLLQALEVRVLDETFAALDAETLDEVMRVVLADPATLLVVAHP